MSSGADPSNTTLRGCRLRVSSSHSRFTVSDQPAIFCTSSSTRPRRSPRPSTARPPTAGRSTRPAQGGFIGAGELHRHRRTLDDLLHHRGLAHLTRTRHHLDEAARLRQAGGEDIGLGALIAQYKLLNMLSNITHDAAEPRDFGSDHPPPPGLHRPERSAGQPGPFRRRALHRLGSPLQRRVRALHRVHRD